MRVHRHRHRHLPSHPSCSAQDAGMIFTWQSIPTRSAHYHARRRISRGPLLHPSKPFANSREGKSQTHEESHGSVRTFSRLPKRLLRPLRIHLIELTRHLITARCSKPHFIASFMMRDPCLCTRFPAGSWALPARSSHFCVSWSRFGTHRHHREWKR